MFSVEEEQKHRQRFNELLQKQVTLEDLSDLRAVIEYCDWRYYVQDNPIVADAEYDTIFRKLKELETSHPEIDHSTSPTQRVASGLNTEFPSVDHLVPMLSLENSYNEEDIRDWDRKCREALPGAGIEYTAEPKFDGASISLVYEQGVLIRAATRGNGIQGDNITLNAKQIRSIPLHIPMHQWGLRQLEVRGEVVITKKNFEKYNTALTERGEQPLANARNAASGSLRIKDPREVGRRQLDAFFYHISFMVADSDTLHPDLRSHSGMLSALHAMGFRTSLQHLNCFQDISALMHYLHHFEEQRDTLPYEIDGMVLKVNQTDQQERIGQTSHHPRWAMAFKFKARQATSKLLAVEYQVGRTGSITPVAKIAPVSVGGVTISSLSLFNEDVVREKQLMLGDTVLIERAGDVIPYVVKSFPELRNGQEQEILFPTHCPVCAEKLNKPEAEAVWRCTNLNCDAQVIERIIHFTSKDAMDIRGLGDALVRRFYELGYLKNIVGIYQLPYHEIQLLEGLGEKSTLKLKEAIEKSKEQPLHRLIFALGIRYVGETTAKALARTVEHLSDLNSKTIDELRQIDDVGEKVAASIAEFFSHPDNRAILDALEQLGVSLKNTQKQEAMQGNLNGKTFLFTGTMTMKRSEAEAMVEQRGGRLLGSVSSKLNYLVVGEDAGSKLEKAKKLGTIHILSEPEFLELLQSGESN